MARSKQAVSATEVARALELSQMAAWHALRRMRDAGELLSSVELVDTPRRINTTVVMYQRLGIKSNWPAWLCPQNLPNFGQRRLVMGEW